MSKPVESVQVEVIDPNTDPPSHYKPWMYRMPDGPGHYFGRPKAGNADCGQKHVIAFLMELSQAWSSHRFKFGIGDIFVPAGPSHRSHFMGSAVDIFVINKNGTEHQLDPVTYQSANYSKEETTALAQLIAITVQRYGGQRGFKEVLYNDKEIQKNVPCWPSITTCDVPRHDDHIHLTFLDSQLPPGYLNFILGIEGPVERLAREYIELIQRLLADLHLLRSGSRGPTVEALQAVLNNQGASQLPALEEDGVFGPKTMARVQEFQRRNSLVPDGIVGPETKKALADKYR